MPIRLDRIQKYGFSRRIGWSNSRYNLFKTCPLQYFWVYYTNYEQKIDSDLLYELKNLTSGPLIKGSAGHEVMETLFERMIQKGPTPLDHEKFKQFITKETVFIIIAR